MDLIEAAYAAATDDLPWSEFVQRLQSAVGATSASLWRGEGQAVAEMLYAPPAPPGWAEAYASHYHRLDPWTQAGAEFLRRSRPDQPSPVYLSEELVSAELLSRGEFYNDFARPLGMFHVVGTVMSLGAAGWLALGCHRPETAATYTQAERATLEGVLPHLRRAMQLRHRLDGARHLAAAAALDAMATGAVVVDAMLRVLHANAAAEGLARRGGLALHPAPSGTELRVENRADGAALARLVAGVALAGADGGAVRLRRSASTQPLAALVMPLPRRMTPGTARMAAPALALVLLRDPDRVALPPASLLDELYRLSAAEAAVALAAAEGATAEQIAAARGVSPSTVRTQLRHGLEKTGAGSLRELTRILTALAG